MKMPLPTEVIVVIIAILSSHFGKFSSNFNVVVVNNVPTGYNAIKVNKNPKDTNILFLDYRPLFFPK